MTYLSTASHLFSELELQQILEVSRSNNSNQAITGILLYHDGAILQVLEGDQDKVTHLFEVLQRDARHHSIFKVMEGVIDARYFSEWSMGFQKLGPKAWDTVQGYLPVSRKSRPFTENDSSTSLMLQFLRSFYEANFS